MSQMLKEYIIRNTRWKNSVIFNFVYMFYLFLKHYISSGYRFYRIGRLSTEKTSDTLVILGAGNTLNELTDENREELSKYNVAGLSYACVFPVDQQFYFYESPPGREAALMQEHVKKVFPAVMEGQKSGRLKSLIWKNSEYRIFSGFEDLGGFICPMVSAILSDNLTTIKQVLRYYGLMGLNRFFLLQKRGSASALVQFALMMRYKKVIFIGVDLNSKGYFFQYNHQYDRYNFLDPYSLEVGDRHSAGHRSNDPAFGLPIIEILQAMIEESDGVEFYVSSPNSELSTFLPIWGWQKDTLKDSEIH